MAGLIESRAQVAALRGRTGPLSPDEGALARALVDQAEREPIFRRRGRQVMALLEEAAALLDENAEAVTRARVLLRLAEVKLVGEDLEAVEQAVGRALALLEAGVASPLSTRLGVARVRSLVRRRRLDEAEDLLAALATSLPDDAPDPDARRAAIAVTLALAEVAVESEALDRTPRSGATSRALFRTLLDATRGDDGFLDEAFAARQGLALAALEADDSASGCTHLREALAIVRGQPDAPEDEIEVRLALAGALAQRGDLAGLEEADKHIQVARDRSIEHGLESHRMAALVAQAGSMARHGRFQGALDRCLEIARAAVAARDVPRYVAAVALMSSFYEQVGDLPSAYRTLADAEATLVSQLGEKAKELTRPHLFALADRMGRNKFVEMVENLRKASQVRDAFERERKPS